MLSGALTLGAQPGAGAFVPALSVYALCGRDRLLAACAAWSKTGALAAVALSLIALVAAVLFFAFGR
jgi:hypothetical protein